MTQHSQINCSLTLFDKTLKLYRYPKRSQHKNLQAWDAADELLIQYIHNELEPAQLTNLLIFNDDFGALGCWLQPYSPYWYSDSYVSLKALQMNLTANDLAAETLQIHDSLTPPVTAQTIVIKLPKSLALLEQQLIDLQAVVSKDTQVIAAAKVTGISKTTLELFEKYLGPTTTSLAQKKARLIFCSPTADKNHISPYPTIWPLPNTAFTISNLANVFSRQSIDIGGRFLIENLPDCSAKTVIDLGCGNGIVGLSVLKKHPDAKIIFVDESVMAVASAKMNIENNMPERLQQCEFVVSNCLDELIHHQANIVLCNPPFHQKNTITDHIAWQMFKDSQTCLYPHGELRVVGNRHLDYQQKLKRLFRGCQVVASNQKFSILSVRKA
ncbi:methyltransferase [Alteromonadaceae bacterium BrNp21-10]|nr:methyltransferase [Alteromonadaceae bacterium BrNp21-10]